MRKLATILKDYKGDKTDKYLSREFQKYGIYLSEKLNDPSHKALYIKLAKTHPRANLDRALSFVLDARARSKAKLFMWYLTRK
ncbi:hypothetical protein HY085_01595 [Candidatus Gottesmanbacteria bacterium]|nr:hypothetical protein [Candidatus Gottesmanbacteria bacterium]